MKKPFLIIFCFIFISVVCVSCKPKPQKTAPREDGQLDMYLTNHPISALLDDIYGLDTALTTGNIVYVRKLFEPLDETLTYELLYENSGGEEKFVKNTEKHFTLSLAKTADKEYKGENGQFGVKVGFHEDGSVFLTVAVYNVESSTVFPYIDNEYPNELIPHYPEGLSVFTAIRGLEYILEGNLLSFERYWIVEKEFAPEFIRYYEEAFKGNHTKEENGENGRITVMSPAKDNIFLIATAEDAEGDAAKVRFVIQYRLGDLK